MPTGLPLSPCSNTTQTLVGHFLTLGDSGLTKAGNKANRALVYLAIAFEDHLTRVYEVSRLNQSSTLSSLSIQLLDYHDGLVVNCLVMMWIISFVEVRINCQVSLSFWPNLGFPSPAVFNSKADCRETTSNNIEAIYDIAAAI
jgi:hypothetical protein